MATEALTDPPQPYYSHDHSAGATVGYSSLSAAGFIEPYRHLVHEFSVARAPGTVQSITAALVAVFAGATVPLVDEPGQPAPLAQFFVAQRTSSGSVGQLLQGSRSTVALQTLGQQDFYGPRGVFAPSFERHVLFTKEVRLTDIHPRATPKLTLIGGREYDDDE